MNLAFLFILASAQVVRGMEGSSEEKSDTPSNASDATPKYKLHYFGKRGRVEPIRLLFHQAGVPFEPVDIKREDWPTIKPTMPFGHVPVLEFDDKVLAESRAIARYIANKYGLAPEDPWEKALCDMYVDGYNDCIEAMWKAMYKIGADSKVTKEEAFLKHRNESLDGCLNKFSNFLDKNGGIYLVGNNVTWADIWVAEHLDQMDIKFGPAMLTTFPKLKVLRDMVFNLPNIKQYVEVRKYQA